MHRHEYVPIDRIQCNRTQLEVFLCLTSSLEISLLYIEDPNTLGLEVTNNWTRRLIQLEE